MTLSLVAAACSPTFDERPWLVEKPAILAVRADPAEARAGAEVRYEPLFVGPGGAEGAERLEWAYCLAPRTLDERNGVSARCLAAEGEDLRPVTPEAAALPAESCARFGPEAPPSEPGQPPLRPADPDPTGGYYQPLRVRDPASGVVAFALQRVTCGLPGAPAEVVAELIDSYTPNRNPAIASLTARVEGVETSSAALARGGVGPGREVSLGVRWTAEDSEEFPAYDPASAALVRRRESMRVSWFTTGGTMERDRTGRSEVDGDAGLFDTENRWTSPAELGPVWIYVVLRDSRGGVSWLGVQVEVR